MHRNNCFDIIRLTAALMVLYSHHYALSGLSEPVIANLESYGGLAVIIFFAISGFLISQSGLRSNDFVDFMSKRCRRIFPALIPCSIFVFIILGSLIKIDDLSTYFSSGVFTRIIQTIILQNAPTNDIASGFIYSSSMLGSLWSLPVEFSCYLIIGLVVSAFKTPRVYPIIFSMFFVASLYVIKTGYTDYFFNVPVHLFVTRGMCFFLGASMAMSLQHWNKIYVKSFLIIILGFYFATCSTDVDHKIAGYIFFTVLTICIGVSFKDKIICGKFDYSYGIYVYAFPVQQVIINAANVGFYTSMIISLALTLMLASISWHYIEKPFLSSKKTINKIKSQKIEESL